MHEEKIELKKEFERRLPEVIQKSKMELKLVLENDGYKKIPTPKSIDNTKFFNNNISPDLLKKDNSQIIILQLKDILNLAIS